VSLPDRSPAFLFGCSCNDTCTDDINICNIPEIGKHVSLFDELPGNGRFFRKVDLAAEMMKSYGFGVHFAKIKIWQ